MLEMNSVDHRTSEKLPQGGQCMTMLNREVSVRRVKCGTRRLECYSLARAVARRLLDIVRKYICRKKKEIVEDVEKECDGDSTSVDHQITSSGDDVSGNQRQEMTFNLVAGLGMLSLINASKTELDKTVELRRQMEVFLTNAKEGHDSKSTTPNVSQFEFTYAVSTTIDGLSNNITPYSQEDHATTISPHEAGISQCNQVYHSERRVEDGISHLEEELAVELERLQLDIETTEISEIQEEVTKISSNAANATKTVTVSSREVINPNHSDVSNAIIPQHSGIPPLELERRLHELLESRQEERIKELETLLESMKIKLQDKELEINWWKDITKIISQQSPAESSRAKVVCDG